MILLSSGPDGQSDVLIERGMKIALRSSRPNVKTRNMTIAVKQYTHHSVSIRYTNGSLSNALKARASLK